MSFFKKIFTKFNKSTKTDSDEVIQKSFIKKDETVNEKTSNHSHQDLNYIFFTNLEMLIEYEILIDGYCDIFEAWGEIPQGSIISFDKIQKEIKKILEEEFTDELCEKIKNNQIDRNEIDSLILKLNFYHSLYQPQLEYTKKREDDLLEKLKNGKI